MPPLSMPRLMCTLLLNQHPRQQMASSARSPPAFAVAACSGFASPHMEGSNHQLRRLHSLPLAHAAISGLPCSRGESLMSQASKCLSSRLTPLPPVRPRRGSYQRRWLLPLCCRENKVGRPHCASILAPLQGPCSIHEFSPSWKRHILHSAPMARKVQVYPLRRIRCDAGLV